MLRRSSLLIAVVLLLALPAGAQSRDEARARLASFSGWAAPDRPLSIAVEVTNPGATPLEDVAVKLTIRERVHSRSALRAALDGNPSGQILAVTTEQFDRPIAAKERVTIPVERDLGSLANAFRPGRAINAVYPLGIALQVAGRPIVQLSGAFAFMGVAPQAPLNLVWVMPIHRPFAADSRGVYPRTPIERELVPGGRLRALADLLTTHAGAPLTLAPTGALADQLLDLSNGFRAAESGKTASVPNTDPLALAANDLIARYRAAIASPAFEVAASSYARASVPTLVGGGLSLDAGRQVTAGRERVTAVFGRSPAPALFADGSFLADVRSARTLAAVGAKTMILDPSVLRAPLEGRFGPDRISDIRASSLSFDGLLVDAPIRARLELETKDPVLTAMGVIAETAASYLELPALASGRMLVIATAATPEPAIASPLLDVLGQAPWVRLRTASDAAGDPALRPTGDTQRLVATPPQPPARFAQARAAHRFVDILRRVVVAPDGADELGQLDRLILVSESADYDAHQGTGASLARAARERAQKRLGRITVPPRRVTLTSRGGQVPVTVVNGTGYDIRVLVRLDSQKVTFATGGATRKISIPGKERGTSFGTLAFSLEAKAAGSFPLTVRVETYDGKDIVGTGQILVRSSAVSAVTFMATAGGALFLAVAWARRALSRRAKRGAAA